MNLLLLTLLSLLITVRYKILEGENFGEMAHSKDWRIKFWQMNKIPYDTKFWREKILAKWLMTKIGG